MYHYDRFRHPFKIRYCCQRKGRVVLQTNKQEKPGDEHESHDVDLTLPGDLKNYLRTEDLLLGLSDKPDIVDGKLEFFNHSSKWK